MSCKLYRWVGLALHLCVNIKQVHGVWVGGGGGGGLVSAHKLSFIHPYIYSGTYTSPPPPSMTYLAINHFHSVHPYIYSHTYPPPPPPPHTHTL